MSTRFLESCESRKQDTLVGGQGCLAARGRLLPYQNLEQYTNNRNYIRFRGIFEYII